MGTKFHKQIAFSANYPPPIYPMSPQVCSFTLNAKNCESVFLTNGMFYSYGRYAILHALKCAGIDNEYTVLMPAYHCRSMIEPAVYLGLKVIFYPVNEKLEPDMSAVQSSIEKHDNAIKAILIVHYFGFTQDTKKIAGLCKQHNIMLIEDCAHAFYDLSEINKMGTVGDFSIASPRKFFPVEDGGVLLDNRKTKEVVKLNKPTLKSEIKSLFHIVEKRIGVFLKPASKPVVKGDQAVDVDIISLTYEKQNEQEGLVYLHTNMMERGGLFSSNWFIKHASHREICEKRRKNYIEFLEKFKNIPVCKPLYTTLPENVVPYVFPLVLSKMPASAFHALKKSGIPLLRWEDIAITDCVVSESYRISLIQLPCHQDLSTKHLDVIASIIGKVMRKIEKL